MKKAGVFLGMALLLVACGENGRGASTNDTLGHSPSAIDEATQHPGGVTNQNVISTDTAAMNVEKMSDTSRQ